MSLRSKVIRLASQKPELRKHLLPLLKEAAKPITPKKILNLLEEQDVGEEQKRTSTDNLSVFEKKMRGIAQPLGLRLVWKEKLRKPLIPGITGIGSIYQLRDKKGAFVSSVYFISGDRGDFGYIIGWDWAKPALIFKAKEGQKGMFTQSNEQIKEIMADALDAAVEQRMEQEYES